MEEAEKRMVFSRDPLCAVPWAQGQDMLSWGVHVLPVGPDAQQRRAAFFWEGTGGKWNFVKAVLSKGSSKVMCDLHMGWMEDGVEEEARVLSRAEVMREGVLVVGGSGKRGAHKMHPCGWRRRKMSRMILGLQRWEEICNQDSFSLVPSLCTCTCVCIPVHVCVCVMAMNSGHCSHCTGFTVRCPQELRNRFVSFGKMSSPVGHKCASFRPGFSLHPSQAGELCLWESASSSFHRILQEVSFHPEKNAHACA